MRTATLSSRDACALSPVSTAMTSSSSTPRRPFWHLGGAPFAAALALAAAAVLGLGHVTAADAATLDGKLAAWKAGGSPHLTHQRVIVRATRKSYLKVAVELCLRGTRVEPTAPALGLMSVVVNRRDLDALLGSADVLGVSSDARVVPTLPGSPVTPEGPGRPRPQVRPAVRPQEWLGPWQESHLAATLGLDTLAIDGSPVTGTGVGVAVIDSGLAPSRDHTIAAFVDFVGGRAVPSDDFGHGTHVAGLIASTGAQSRGLYRGVAPGARLGWPSPTSWRRATA